MTNAELIARLQQLDPNAKVSLRIDAPNKPGEYQNATTDDIRLIVRDLNDGHLTICAEVTTDNPNSWFPGYEQAPAPKKEPEKHIHFEDFE